MANRARLDKAMLIVSHAHLTPRTNSFISSTAMLRRVEFSSRQNSTAFRTIFMCLRSSFVPIFANSMYSTVFTKRNKTQIFNFIVKGVTVYMVDMLSWINASTQVLFHYVSMFSHLLTANSDKFIATMDCPLSPFSLPIHPNRSMLFKPLIVLRAKPFGYTLFRAIFNRASFHTSHHNLSLMERQANWLEIARSSNGA